MYNYNTDSLGLILGVEVFFSGGHCSGALCFVIIWLLVTYVALFGLSSVEKYIEKDVNIINQEENPTTIVPPGEIISFIIDIIIFQKTGKSNPSFHFS